MRTALELNESAVPLPGKATISQRESAEGHKGERNRETIEGLPRFDGRVMHTQMRPSKPPRKPKRCGNHQRRRKDGTVECAPLRPETCLLQHWQALISRIGQ